MSSKSSHSVGNGAYTTRNPPLDVSLSKDFDVKEVPEDNDVPDGNDRAASRLILYHEGRIDPMKDECHYQVKH